MIMCEMTRSAYKMIKICKQATQNDYQIHFGKYDCM